MADVRPFRALRPRDDLAAAIIAPPYDVLTDEQARAIAEDRRSFVRVTRPEVDHPPGTDPHSEAVYRTAKANLASFQEQGLLIRDDRHTYYFYGQAMGDHRQVGIIAGASVEEYDRGVIKKHELTRPDKEDDRTHHMNVIDAQVGLVFLTYRAHPELARQTLAVTAEAPRWSVTTADGVTHSLWVAPAANVHAIRVAFEQVEALYIADGHHRSAAASRTHALRSDASTEHFLAGLFPDDSLLVMSYNRVIDDLNGHTPDAFLHRLQAKFHITSGPPVPAQRGHISMYLGGSWRTLVPRDGVVNEADPVARLDVSILQDHLLCPALDIVDPRRSTRVRFVGGIHGPSALERAVDQGAAVAFHLYPTGLNQLFEVADAGLVMPPKSTWFEAKLREGVATRLIRG